VWYYRGLVLEKLCHQAQVRNRTALLTGAPILPFEDLVRQATESFDRATALKPEDPRAREAKVNLYTGLCGDDPETWSDHGRAGMTGK
jgi:hypothetical protein